MKTLIKLLIITIVLVGIAWVVMSLVKFPGNIANLQKIHNKNYQQVTQINLNNTNAISLSTYNVTEFNKESADYLTSVNTFKTNLTNIVIKEGFSWDEEKLIKAEMQETFNVEKQLKEYLASLVLYINSSQVHAETAQNMINISTNKFTELVAKYNLLCETLQSYAKVTETE